MKMKMHHLVEKYYSNWLGSTTLLGHPDDRERFYRFVKAYCRYTRKPRNGQWLRYFLERDMLNRYPDKEYTENKIIEIVSLFDYLIDFFKVDFPKPILEMHDPYKVMSEMQRKERGDGSKFFSEEEIKATIERNFGKDWKKRYLLRRK